MGRTGERERFVRDFFKHFGVDTEGEEARGPIRVTLTRGLKQRLRIKERSELQLVFRAEDLEQFPEGQLMVPGNAIFDRLVAIARRFGGVSCRYRRARRALMEDAAARQALGNPVDGLELELGPNCYRSSFLFTFRIAYRAIDSFDEIHSVMLSGLSGRYHEGNGFFRGMNLAETPEEEIADDDAPDVAALMVGALEEIERRVGADVDRFVGRAESQLGQERERLKQFFTDLIDEEKAQLRRKAKAPSVGAAERKLEWVQRLDRENRLFAPAVSVSLLGLEEIRVPVRPISLRRGEEVLMEADLDLASGELAGVRCGSCGVDVGTLRFCDGEHVVCAECLEVCALCAP